MVGVGATPDQRPLIENDSAAARDAAGPRWRGWAYTNEDSADLEVRQKAWAKFLFGLYLSAFVALGLHARLSEG